MYIPNTGSKLGADIRVWEEEEEVSIRRTEDDEKTKQRNWVSSRFRRWISSELLGLWGEERSGREEKVLRTTN